MATTLTANFRRKRRHGKLRFGAGKQHTRTTNKFHNLSYATLMFSHGTLKALSCLLFGSDVLSFEERKTISWMREQKCSQSEIARRLGRDRATISREIRRNYWHDREFPDAYGYWAMTANDMARDRRRRVGRLFRREDLRTAVIGKLEERRPRYARKPQNPVFPEARSIKHRPKIINERKEFGHWEADLMIFQRVHGDANVATVVERTSRFTVLFKNNDRQSKPIMDRLINVLGPLPRHARQSLTFDRGFEFVSWRRLKQGMGTDAWFCDPSAPWQKGSVENMNRRIRRYLPRDTAVLSVPEGEIRSLIDRLNNTPRKCLSFYTPAEVFRREVTK